MESPQYAIDSPPDEAGPRAPDSRDRVSEGATDGRSAASRNARQPLLISVLLVASLGLGVLAALTPRYETNDDAGMNAIAAGRCLVDRPDEHILFSNVLIGCGLKFLYQAAPRIPWYGASLYVTGCLSLAAVCFVCLRHDLCEWTVGLTGAFLWVAGIPALTQLQFTRIAFLAGLAGLLLLAGAVRVVGSPLLQWCAVPFLVAGGLIRFRALLLVCVVLSPAIAWIVWRARFQKSARASLLLLGASLAVGMAAARFNNWYYESDPAWRDFIQLGALDSEIIDFGRATYNARTAPVFASVGWQPIDLRMLQNWAFLDRERYNSRTVQALLDGSAPNEWQTIKPWHPLFEQLVSDGELLGLLAFGAACLAILAIDRSARFIPLACYGVTAVTCLLLYQRLHLVPRIYCPVASACAITVIAFSSGPRSFGNRRAWVESAFGRRAAMIVVAAVILWRGLAMWRSNANFLSFHRSAVEMLTELAPKPNQLFVVWGGDFPYEYVALPLSRDFIRPDFKTLTLNWTIHFTQSRMDKIGVHDLMSLVRRGGETYFICQKSDNDLLSAYCRAHYGVKLKYRVAFAHPALYDSAVYEVTVDGVAPRS